MSIGMFENRLADAEGGTTRTAKGIQRIGIDFKDVNVAVDQVIEHLSKYEAGVTRTAEAQTLFGRAGKEWAAVTDVITENFGNLENMRKSFAAMGIEVGENSVKAAQKFVLEQK